MIWFLNLADLDQEAIGKMKSSRHRLRDRNASVTLEFILVLPFLVVTLLAIAQFSVALLLRQAVTHAAVVGAREAGKYEDISEVARAVDGVLQGAHEIDVATVSLSGVSPPYTATVLPVGTSGVQIALEVGSGVGPVTTYFPPAGDPNFIDCPLPATPSVQSDEVRVTVGIDLGRSPMFNWLYSFSPDYVDFGNRCFSVSSLVKKE